MAIEIEHRLTVVEDRSKSNQHRIDEIEKRQDDIEKLATSVEVLAIRETNVETDVREIKSDVKSLAGKSGQRWERVVETLITVVVSAIVGFIIAKFGM